MEVPSGVSLPPPCLVLLAAPSSSHHELKKQQGGSRALPFPPYPALSQVLPCYDAIQWSAPSPTLTPARPVPPPSSSRCYHAIMLYGGLVNKHNKKHPNKEDARLVMSGFTPEEQVCGRERWVRGTGAGGDRSEEHEGGEGQGTSLKRPPRRAQESGGREGAEAGEGELGKRGRDRGRGGGPTP